MKLLAVVLISTAVLGAASCNDITGNDGNFVFDVMGLTYEDGMVDEAEVIPYTRGVQANGVIVLPNSCYALGGEHDINRGVITMTVKGTQVNSQCPPGVDAATYRFQSFGLNRGVYRVRVVHDLAGTPSRVIIEEDVTVN